MKKLNENNFDLLRFIAASLVIITHSYALIGIGENDFLVRLTKKTLSFSHLGVAIFFVMSGYLILQSAINTKSVLSYFWKRILRIIPGLFAVLLICVFILGPIISTLSLGSYFSKSETYLHLLSVTIYNISHLDLPGVFVNNPTNAVNGSLWTLQYEFTCYIFVAFFVFIFPIRVRVKNYLLVGIFILMIFIRIFLGEKYFWFNYSSPFLLGLNLMYTFEWFVYFISGMVLFIMKDKLKSVGLVSALLLIFYVLFLILNYTIFARYLLYLLVPVIVYYIVFKLPRISFISKYGDISYGMYIYAFPVQQLIICMFPKINIDLYIIISILITIPFALFSWHLIEKRALKYKNRI